MRFIGFTVLKSPSGSVLKAGEKINIQKAAEFFEMNPETLVTIGISDPNEEVHLDSHALRYFDVGPNDPWPS